MVAQYAGPGMCEQPVTQTKHDEQRCNLSDSDDNVAHKWGRPSDRPVSMCNRTGNWKLEGKRQPTEDVDRSARRKECTRSDGVVPRLRPRGAGGKRPAMKLPLLSNGVAASTAVERYY